MPMASNFEKVFIDLFHYLLQFVQGVEDANEQNETSLMSGCCPRGTKHVVFCSHEVELVHILVGKNNERLTSAECAVKILRWGREGAEEGREPREAGRDLSVVEKGGLEVKGQRVIDGPHTRGDVRRCKLSEAEAGKRWRCRTNSGKIKFCLRNFHWFCFSFNLSVFLDITLGLQTEMFYRYYYYYSFIYLFYFTGIAEEKINIWQNTKSTTTNNKLPRDMDTKQLQRDTELQWKTR